MRLCPLLALVIVGCVGSDAIDGENDRYIVDGKADTGGIQEGTAEAAAVLQVASTFSRADLVNDVGLAAKAADNVIAYRNGDDETANTADDEKFESLAELDAVPFMGPIAFGKLLAYAQANDLVEGNTPPPVTDNAFDPAACQGPNMSMAAAMQRWSTNARLGTYQLKLRKRTCTTGTSSTCEPWRDVSLSDVPWAPDASGVLDLAKYDGEIRLKLQARLCQAAGYPGTQYVVGSVCDGVGEDLYCSGYDNVRQCFYYESEFTDHRLLWDKQLIRLNGKLTENCVQLIHKSSANWVFEPKRTEYEAAVLKRF